ncbi:DNA topoisomerase 2 [Megavirus lba]|uniref:DNA topoisomerase (ATP-hydrolyzing) n=1 Tax=Megavirus lba TaxID=1235314 RepID=L7Y2J0_9VIRU|nr:DNA topoisomerase 2 [Megavirus lba]
MSKTSKKSSEKTIEEKYQKKNLHEHILHSPDTYIGSIEDKTCNMWIYNNKFKEGDAQIIFKEISYVPGLYKIYDEVLVNSADHSKRCKSCNMIKVDINEESGEISVWNNGDGIDVVEHKEHKIMVPSMIFGELLTSTNYDKGEKKLLVVKMDSEQN